MVDMRAKRGALRKIAAAGLAVAIIASLPTAVAASDETPRAAVELRVSDVKFEKLGRHGQFTYTREFIDHGGTGARLRHGQVCFGGGGCISAPVEYLIEAGGVLLQEGQFLMPTAVSQTFDFTYIGEDGDGREITVKARILVVGDQLELQELE
jgi:hypothetical protein